MTGDKAKEILEEIKVNDDNLTQYIAGFDEALDMAIEALEHPQEPKTGHWWERDTYPQECECWDCSECQETVFERTNYCPNCGAKMVEPQESERL
jgi:Zn finger protein HypA/HybF involved in hydrogenase expression